VPNSTSSASSFLSTLGVNAHSGNANNAYGNASLTISSLKYLGIGTVRDTLPGSGIGNAVVNAMAAAGVKFDFVTSSGLPATGASGLANYVASLTDFQTRHAGSIVAIEGLNEVNTQEFSYNGSGSLASAVAYQKALYAAVKGTAGLSGVSVINMSIALESPSAYAAIGDLGAYSDFANAHAYTASGGLSDKVMEASMARAAAASKGDKVVITETGYTTLSSDPGLGVNESAQAKLTVNALLTAFENGSSQTFLYELFDSSLNPSGSEKEFHFGLFMTGMRGILAKIDEMPAGVRVQVDQHRAERQRQRCSRPQHRQILFAQRDRRRRHVARSGRPLQRDRQAQRFLAAIGGRIGIDDGQYIVRAIGRPQRHRTGQPAQHAVHLVKRERPSCHNPPPSASPRHRRRALSNRRRRAQSNRPPPRCLARRLQRLPLEAHHPPARAFAAGPQRSRRRVFRTSRSPAHRCRASAIAYPSAPPP
jgi:hypothetical protein